ncbi:hypothetical protein [Actinomadura macrotermitis]|uniref:Uncharacterized protein n=1 Tax=Actinomadura macrotermitis TaxID=2585200 RepID=A0A7K0BW23_9ACTN|nr:hypothetical protein [Actinomadura macrotermitis]MQY05380.1 hypothetical protein [Actinomadura macrotermitis]
MAHDLDGELPRYEEIDARLTDEFAGVHAPDTVARCVAAALHGAREIMGGAPPELVERIARRHLEVLALVAAEKRRRAPRPG